MKRLSLVLSVVVLLLLVAGVGTAAAQTPTQDTGQLASSDQGAAGAAGTAQQEPTNRNVSVRVLSPGDDGPVSQTNEATSDATAGNLNATSQDADQTQAGSGGQQTVGQSATSDQDALALALTLQQGASNENAPVRVLSEGDNGPVSQTNDASSEATAGNTNVAAQDADQTQAGGTLCCGSDGTQAVGQSADSDQDAAAFSGTVQEKPSNTNISVRVLSPGDNGPVTQSNEASSDATAANLNATKQTADQDQTGGACPCGQGGTQVVGQKADSEQKATAGALTVQKGAENKNIDVRVLSPGDNGPVTQSNVASSSAAAGNTNVTEQDADQDQAGGHCKCAAGTQIIGQAAKNDQDAKALSATIQEKPSNTNSPIRVLSPGDDGPVSQANVATSTAVAGNLNVTKQDADQAQGGSGLQVIGQAAFNDQDAFALGVTFQKGASNENAPVRVLSKGDDGPVSQLNLASSTALAGNSNWTAQDASQAQGGHTACCGSGIQAIGQLALNRQSAGALAATFQLGAKQPCRCKDDSGLANANEPTRVLSKGDGGPVRQANVATSTAYVANWNATKQKAEQIQAGPCLCLADGIQATGQLADSSQLAFGLAAVLQLGGDGRSKAPERGETPRRKGVMSTIE